MLLAALAWLPSAVASELEEPEAVAAAPAPIDATFAAALERAKQAYFEGRSVEALSQFQRLELRLKSGGETPPWAEAAEAMTWLAELHYARGAAEKAEETFRWILERDLDTAMLSPYHHPIEVVSLFEDVRAQVEVERQTASVGEEPIALVGRPRQPAWTWLPLGVPQFSQGRPAAGVTFVVLQVGFGATSLITAAHLSKINRDLEGQDPPPSDADLDVLRPEYTRWQVVNIASFGLMGVSFGASVRDAQAAWRRDHPAPTVTLGLTPAGVPGFTFRGTL